MAVTATWNLYSNVPNFTNAFIDVPYLNIKFSGSELNSDLSVLGLKLFGSEAKYAELFLVDEFADIFYTDQNNNEFNVDLTTKGLTLEVAKFWVKKVRSATTTNLSGTYTNGANGIGAILTGSGSLIIDTVNVSINSLILVKNQTNSVENGVYIVAEKTSNYWKLVRTEDTDSVNEISDMLVVLEEPSDSQQVALNWIVDVNPTTMGVSNINFQKIGTVTSGDVKTLEDHFTDRSKWVNILTRVSSEMKRFRMNDDSIYLDDGVTPNPNYNRPMTLNQGFMSISNLIAIRMTRPNTGFNSFNIKNLKFTAQFRTKEPNISARPVKIFTAPGIPVIQDTNQVEYYIPAISQDNINYNTGTTWTNNDSVEVFAKPEGGIITPVNGSKYLYSGVNGTITFLQPVEANTIIYVTITRPLITPTLPSPA